MKKILAIIAAIIPLQALAVPVQKASFRFYSPDKKLEINVNTGAEIRWTVIRDGKEIITDSPLSVTCTDGTVLGSETYGPKCTKTTVKSKKNTPGYKDGVISYVYNEMKLSFKTYDLVFRAFDEGFAYRFVPRSTMEFDSEEAAPVFADDFPVKSLYMTTSADGDIKNALPLPWKIFIYKEKGFNPDESDMLYLLARPSGWQAQPAPKK